MVRLVVMEQMFEVYNSGRVNIFNQTSVLEYAKKHEYKELVSTIESHQRNAVGHKYLLRHFDLYLTTSNITAN